MYELDFRLEKERLEGGIREQKVEQYTAKLDRERLVTQKEWVEVEIAREELTQANLRLEIAQENTAQLRTRLSNERLQSQLSEVHLEMTRNQLSAAHMEQRFQFELLAAKLESLDLRLTEARTENDHYRQELSARGFSPSYRTINLSQILGGVKT